MLRTVWDLNSGLFLLYFRYTVCASCIKEKISFNVSVLNLLSDTLDYSKFFTPPSAKLYYTCCVIVP